MPEQITLDFSKIQHVGIPVKDLMCSVPFYQSLGFVEVMRKHFDHEEGIGTCVMLKKQEILMELYQMPDSVIKRDISKRSDGIIDHIAFDVEDIQIAFHTLSMAGFQVLQESPVTLDFWQRGCSFFHVIGPDGERLEFNQVL